MTFEEEVTKLIEDGRAAGTPMPEIQAAVAACFECHGRELPRPIIGTLKYHEKGDSFAKK